MISCRDCKHFLPGTIGNGSGIGQCAEYNAYLATKPSAQGKRMALMSLGQNPNCEVFWGGSRNGVNTRTCEKYQQSGLIQDALLMPRASVREH